MRSLKSGMESGGWALGLGIRGSGLRGLDSGAGVPMGSEAWGSGLWGPRSAIWSLGCGSLEILFDKAVVTIFA